MGYLGDGCMRGVRGRGHEWRRAGMNLELGAGRCRGYALRSTAHTHTTSLPSTRTHQQKLHTLALHAAGTYDYQDMKKVILPYVPAGGMNISRDTFWEIVNREMTKDLWSVSGFGLPEHRTLSAMWVRAMDSRAPHQGHCGAPSHRNLPRVRPKGVSCATWRHRHTQ